MTQTSRAPRPTAPGGTHTAVRSRLATGICTKKAVTCRQHRPGTCTASKVELVLPRRFAHRSLGFQCSVFSLKWFEDFGASAVAWWGTPGHADIPATPGVENSSLVQRSFIPAVPVGLPTSGGRAAASLTAWAPRPAGDAGLRARPPDRRLHATNPGPALANKMSRETGGLGATVPR